MIKGIGEAGTYIEVPAERIGMESKKTIDISVMQGRIRPFLSMMTMQTLSMRRGV